MLTHMSPIMPAKDGITTKWAICLSCSLIQRIVLGKKFVAMCFSKLRLLSGL